MRVLRVLLIAGLPGWSLGQFGPGGTITSAGSSPCPCITQAEAFPSSNGNVAGTVTISGTVYNYPASYGIGCGAHDQNTEPDCVDPNGVNPSWCDKAWCFVDLNACLLASGESQYYTDPTLTYSYSTCGSTDSFGCFDASTVTLLNFQGAGCPGPDCVEADTYCSNLGNAGFSSPRVPTDPTNCNGAEGILIRNIARAKMKDSASSANGHLLHLQMNALSEYKTSSSEFNGINSYDEGGFAVINVMSPSTASDTWHQDVNFVDIQLTIIDSVTNAPLDVTGGFETWITFYDFDELTANDPIETASNPNYRERECGSGIALNGGTVTSYLEEPTRGGTQLVTVPLQDLFDKIDNDPTYALSQKPQDPTGLFSANPRTFCSSDTGTGNDNPSDPVSLTELQRQRSIYTKVSNTNAVVTRLFVEGCCNGAGKGRNYLFGGRPLIEPCGLPPPSPPPPPPPVVVQAVFDPHFTFAHGGKADFRGEDNTWYNLLSAKNLSLNVLFTAADFKILNPTKQLVHGSRMEKLAMMVRTNTGRIVTIEYNATHTFPFTALVHQVSEPPRHLMLLTTEKKTARSYEIDNLKLSMRVKKVGLLSNAGHGTTLVISDGRWEVSAMSKPFPNPRAHPNKALLNVKLRTLYDVDRDIVAPHGIIGQSYDRDGMSVDGRTDDYKNGGPEVTTSAMAEGALEGHASDYKMPHRFATDFKFTRFDAVAAAPRDVSLLTGEKHSASFKGTAEVGATADVDDADEE